MSNMSWGVTGLVIALSSATDAAIVRHLTDRHRQRAQTGAIALHRTTIVDERQRLEREVEQHRAAMAELLESIRDIEENLGDVVNAPAELLRQASALRIALKGRRSAVEIGAARLEVLIRVEALEALEAP